MMLNKNGIFLLALIICTTSQFTYGTARINGSLTINSDESGSFTLTCTPPEVKLVGVNLDGRNFQKIDVSADGFYGEPGGPALPSWSRWIEVPDGMKPRLQVYSESESVLSNIDIAPFPTLESDNPNLSAAHAAAFSSDLYANEDFSPVENASVTSTMTVGGKRWAIIGVTPYRYSAGRRELKIAQNLHISVTFEPDPASPPSDSRTVAPAWRELNMTLGETQPQRDDEDLRQDHLGHYVIVVANEDLIEPLETLIEWKKRKGYMVTVADFSEIGRTAADLAEWLQAAWDEWDVPPTFVLLAGDAQGQGEAGLPFHRDGLGPQQGYYVTDNIFVSFEQGQGNNDPENWIPEAFIGRLPVGRAVDLERQAAKILAYEMEPFTDDPWVEGAVLIADGVHSCIPTNQAIGELMIAAGYEEDNVHEAYGEWHLNQHPDLNIVNQGVDDGVGFVNFRGYNDWGHYTTDMIHARRNGSRMPIVTGMVCETNEFPNLYVGETFGEAWIRAWSNGPRGGVACFGPTDRWTHTWFNNTMDAEFYHSILNNGVQTLGVACLASKLRLISTYPSNLSNGNGLTVGYYIYTYTLFGDPSLQIWTHEPMQIEVEFENELPVGTTEIVAVVIDDFEEPVSGAYVHVYQDGDPDMHIGAYSDDNGWVRLFVDHLEEGEYMLTVTGPNLVPVLETIEVAPASIFTSIAEISIDDDNEDESRGNDDGILSPGERVELVISQVNTGTEACGNLSSILSSRSPWIEINRDSVEYGEIDVDAVEAGDQPFVITVAPETPDGEEVLLTLTSTSDDEEWSTDFTLEIVGYQFEISDMTLSDELLPGSETRLIVTIENTGQIDAPDLTATLFCSDRNIQIRQAEAEIDPLGRNESRQNDDQPFVIYAGPFCYQGSTPSFGLLLTDEAGLRDSIIFPIQLGEPTVRSPQGPDKYGYWAFDTRDTTGGMNAEYDWMVGRTSLQLTDNNDNQSPTGLGGSRTFVDLPFGFEFVYYGQRYNEITVGSNGWLSFERTDQVSWNNQELGSPLGPAAMVCPYWEDLWSGQVYKYYDREGARFIIEWRNYQSAQGRVSFAVHLYDPTVIVTETGDGEIVFQYNEIPELQRDFADENVTIGISSPDRLDGLQIIHARNSDPRTADLRSEMAVRFTTGTFMERGSITGQIIDAEDDSPLDSVRVMIDGTGFFNVTDERGEFDIQGVPIGIYSIVASKKHFNDAAEMDVEILLDEQTVVNLALTHPTFNTDVEQIRVIVEPDSTEEVMFDVWNEGNGPLDYKFKLNTENYHDNEPWDVLFDYPVSEIVDDGYLMGVAFDGEFFHISGQLVRREYPHKMYVIDQQGELVREYDQYSVDSAAFRGYYELDWNGQNIVAVEYSKIVEITTNGEFVRAIDTQENPTQAVAWADERNSLFVKSRLGNDFYELDIDGNVIETYPVGVDRINLYGIYWHSADLDGFPLYFFLDNRDDEEAPSRLRLMKMNIETGESRLVKDIVLLAGDRPYGMDITNDLDPLIWTFVGLIDRSYDDRLVGWELAPNLKWITYAPEEGSIPFGERQQMTVGFDGGALPNGLYNITLELIHNAVGDRLDIPVTFGIGPQYVNQDEDIIPQEFSLESIWPNPFNSMTKLAFNLPEATPVRLAVWDVSGRLITEFDYGRMPVGRHEIRFDGSNLSSGLYITRLTAGKNSATQKVLLLR